MGDLIDTPLTELKGIGQKRAEQFAEAGIHTVLDLLYFMPRDYIDYSNVQEIDNLRPGKVTIQVSLDGPVKTWRKGRRHFTQAVFADDTGKIKAVWYNQPYRSQQLDEGVEYMVSGELSFYGRQYSLQHPSVEKVESQRLSTGVVVARYSSVKGLNSRMILSAQKRAVELLPDGYELYPKEFALKHELTPLKDALAWLHFPDNAEQQENANKRLSFDEIFALQLSARLEKAKLELEPSYQLAFNETLARKFVKGLEFTLTDAQRTSAWEILKDVDSDTPMNRLLEGDVGSGKTIVSAMVLLMCADNKYQSAYLAPTTILAEQQYKNLTDILGGYKIKTALLTRHTKTADKKKILTDVASGKIDVLIGTHSIAGDGVEFKDLAVLVVDEQHRFGVEQRRKLIGKSKQMPHVLTMTATPIPRSLALTLYGELDISIIRYKPEDRLPVETKLLAHSARSAAYEHVKTEVEAGKQAYVVAPRIEKDADLPSVERLSEELGRTFFQKFKVGVLHGRMKSEEKEDIMTKFNSGKLDVLISTTIVEVGLDNPKATIMVIEGADRYGLAQLHQLRGRVGRGEDQSHCYIISAEGMEPTRRLRAMESASDGFALSELDLHIRGPGALYGVRQHGPLDLNIADITDRELIMKTKTAVDDFVENKYNLARLNLLRRRIENMRSTTYLN